MKIWKHRFAAQIGRNTELIGKIHLGKSVQIGSNTILGAGCISRSDTDGAPLRIGDEVRIGPYCLIGTGTTLDDRVVVEPYASIDCHTSVGSDTRVLYRAQIYREVAIGRSAVVGGFVCDGAVVEDRCRVFGKLVHRAAPPWGTWEEHREPSPIIQEGAFVGMDALVIGGIRIGEGAYVAAGAVVTKDVPPLHYVVGTNRISPLPWKTAA